MRMVLGLVAVSLFATSPAMAASYMARQQLFKGTSASAGTSTDPQGTGSATPSAADETTPDPENIDDAANRIIAAGEYSGGMGDLYFNRTYSFPTSYASFSSIGFSAVQPNLKDIGLSPEFYYSIWQVAVVDPRVCTRINEKVGFVDTGVGASPTRGCYLYGGFRPYYTRRMGPSAQQKAQIAINFAQAVIAAEKAQYEAKFAETHVTGQGQVVSLDGLFAGGFQAGSGLAVPKRYWEVANYGGWLFQFVGLEDDVCAAINQIQPNQCNSANVYFVRFSEMGWAGYKPLNHFDLG